MNDTALRRAVRLALLTSRGGGHCMHIAERIDAGALAGVELVAVVTDNPQAPVIEKCRQRGIALHVLAWPGAQRRAEHDRAIDARLRELRVDLVGLVGYLRLVGADLVAAWRGRMFNLHPSLLPAFPGLNAIERAYAAGARRFGATVHWVDEGCDTGAIIVQRGFSLTEEPPIEEVKRRVHALEAALLEETLTFLAATLPQQAHGG